MKIKLIFSFIVIYALLSLFANVSLLFHIKVKLFQNTESKKENDSWFYLLTLTNLWLQVKRSVAFSLY